MDRITVFKKVTEVEGIPAKELRKQKEWNCPICGKSTFSLDLPFYFFEGCHEHITIWIVGYSTQSWLYPLDVFLDKALAVYDHYLITDEVREQIRDQDTVDLSEVAYRLGAYLQTHSPLWAGFDDVIRLAKEERQLRDGENSYEAQKKRTLEEYEASGKLVMYIDGYGREVDKDGNLLPPKEIVEAIPNGSAVGNVDLPF